MVEFEITYSKIDEESLRSSLLTPMCGGECTFVGRVRSPSRGREVRGIMYSLHESLAHTLFSPIGLEYSTKWAIPCRAKIVHRIGFVPVGEAAVIVSVLSPHRSEAFEGCRFLIERVKHNLPIWKKELFQNGESEWIDGCTLCAIDISL